MVFGHFSDNPSDILFQCFERFGKRNDIPVVYTDDFGHGTKHAVFPIGSNVKFNADARTLEFMDYHDNT